MDNYSNHDLTEEQWKRIQPLQPPENTGKKGRRQDADTENLSIDSTCVKIHESSNVGKKQKIRLLDEPKAV